MSAVGQRIQRLEDPRLLLGLGRFVDDVDRPGQVWMRVVRASTAHARITSVDLEAARALPGVHVALAAEHLGDVPTIPLRLGPADEPLDAYLQPVLASERVRYVGEPVAVVVADDPYLAEDAADLVRVEFEELPVVLDAREAAAAGSPALRDGLPNECTTLRRGYGDVEGAFERAARVVSVDVRVGRHFAVPMETRGLLAEYDPGDRHLTMWGATKVPHFNRLVLAEMLGMPVYRISLPRSDAGGGFGARGEFYPEDFLVAYLARRLGRAVKWIEDRAENLVACNHSREQWRRLEAAFDEDHQLLGIRDELWHDNGAYLRTHGAVVAELTLGMLPGPYRLPAYQGVAHVALTNKTPCGTYRGPGRYEGTFARERLLDVAAAELGVDPLELRRMNLLRPDELPLERKLPVLGHDAVIDVGDFPGLFEKALGGAGYAQWREEAAALRAQGRLVGTGLGVFMEKSGGGRFETAGVEVDPSGAVRVATGGASVGQGIETALAQIAADALGVEVQRIDVIPGDTDLIGDGAGSWASRSTIMGGSAVKLAAEATAEKARRIAAELLEAAPEDLRLEGGRVVVTGAPHRSVSLGEVSAAYDPLFSERLGEEPGEHFGLGAQRSFSNLAIAFPYGVHMALVEIDPETGEVRILRYHIAYDVGRAINPMIVEGQLVGGAAQGIGGALLEDFRYAPSGQPLGASFMDYLLPTAAEIPHVETSVHEDAPSPTNPLGAKGAGEGGTVGCGAALASAVDDALRVPGAVRALPITPEQVLSALRPAGGAVGGSDDDGPMEEHDAGRARAVGREESR
jgi:carbon-monoxide dehydrogenase large subunit/6-hydroxypseudooxynicotine dehydrogenase subunit gamma